MSDWLSKYVDFKVLINLEERIDRYDETMLEFEKIGISDIYHISFSGGKTSTRNKRLYQITL